ncbi:hypothetical protein ACLOJK_026862, partial [Asimina triloba]
SPIGSTRSGCEVSVTAGRAGAALIGESISVVPVAHSPGSFSHISLPLPKVSDLLFSGGGADDLNVDNVDQPLGLPGVDTPILCGSFFALASPGHPERSPSFVHRAGSSGEGGMSKIEGPARRRVSFPGNVTGIHRPYFLRLAFGSDPDDGFPTGTASMSTDAALGRVAEPIVPVEGRAPGAVVPDSNEGSGGNSSVRQYVPTGGAHRVAMGDNGSGGSSSAPTPPLDINVDFIEPFRELGSSCSVQLQKSLHSLVQKQLARIFSSFRDGFIESMDALSDLHDLNHLLDLCGVLE